MKPKKSGASRKHYINYIATRENVEKINLNENIQATIKQSDFIKKIIKDFKDAKELLEYEDFINNPTRKNASELIDAVFERVDELNEDREEYIKYIAKRPRVEKINTHGLFSNDGVVENLNNRVKEISEHKGNVWSHVLSLRRNDAETLGYNNYKAFKDLVDENLIHIAQAHKIKIENLKYVCAFHNESHHPHIHLIIYSTNPKEGYLTEQGIESIRSKFANSIFKDEMYYNFNEQNELRDRLRCFSKEQVNKILTDIENKEYNDEKVLILIKELLKKLKVHKGSKTYKWFTKQGNEEIKNLIDELAKEISKDENVKKLYDDWYKAKENNLRIYRNTMPERVALHENETFRTLQNHIINEILAFDINKISNEKITEENTFSENYIDEKESDWRGNEDVAESIPCEYLEQNEFDAETTESTENNLYVKWSKKYKSAKEILYKSNEDKNNIQKAYELLHSEAQSGNILGIYDVALLNKNEVVKDEKIDVEFNFNTALTGFKNLCAKGGKLQPYLEYRIGKMNSLGYGTEKNEVEAIEWFLKSAEKGNQFAQFSLGNCYFYGNGTEVDYLKAFEYYKLSAEQNNIFADYKLGEMYEAGIGTDIDEDKSFSCYKNAFNGFIKIANQDIDGSMHLKIGSMYEKGVGTEVSLFKAEEFYTKALNYNKDKPKYKLGKLYLSTEFKEVINPEQIKEKIEQGVKYLEEIIIEEKDTSKYATYILGKAYLYNKDLGIDIEKAKEYLLISAELGNDYAEQLYKRIVEFENNMYRQGYKNILGRIGGLIVRNSSNEDMKYQRENGRAVDRKLMNKIAEKKREQGLKF